MKNYPNRRTDRMLLKAFSVGIAMTRAWLFMKGHVAASQALRDITYEDAEDAFELLREEATSPKMTDERARELLGALEGGPRSEGSILPTLAEAREVTASFAGKPGE